MLTDEQMKKLYGDAQLGDIVHGRHATGLRAVAAAARAEALEELRKDAERFEAMAGANWAKMNEYKRVAMAARNEALEEAAKVCEAWGLEIGEKVFITSTKPMCAAAIRALAAAKEK